MRCSLFARAGRYERPPSRAPLWLFTTSFPCISVPCRGSNTLHVRDTSRSHAHTLIYSELGFSCKVKSSQVLGPAHPKRRREPGLDLAGKYRVVALTQGCHLTLVESWNVMSSQVKSSQVKFARTPTAPSASRHHRRHRPDQPLFGRFLFASHFGLVILGPPWPVSSLTHAARAVRGIVDGVEPCHRDTIAGRL